MNKKQLYDYFLVQMLETYGLSEEDMDMKFQEFENKKEVIQEVIEFGNRYGLHNLNDHR